MCMNWLRRQFERRGGYMHCYLFRRRRPRGPSSSPGWPSESAPSREHIAGTWPRRYEETFRASVSQDVLCSNERVTETEHKPDWYLMDTMNIIIKGMEQVKSERDKKIELKEYLEWSYMGKKPNQQFHEFEEESSASECDCTLSESDSSCGTLDSCRLCGKSNELQLESRKRTSILVDTEIRNAQLLYDETKIVDNMQQQCFRMDKELFGWTEPISCVIDLEKIGTENIKKEKVGNWLRVMQQPDFPEESKHPKLDFKIVDLDKDSKIYVQEGSNVVVVEASKILELEDFEDAKKDGLKILEIDESSNLIGNVAEAGTIDCSTVKEDQAVDRMGDAKKVDEVGTTEKSAREVEVYEGDGMGEAEKGASVVEVKGNEAVTAEKSAGAVEEGAVVVQAKDSGETQEGAKLTAADAIKRIAKEESLNELDTNLETGKQMHANEHSGFSNVPDLAVSPKSLDQNNDGLKVGHSYANSYGTYLNILKSHDLVPAKIKHIKGTEIDQNASQVSKISDSKLDKGMLLFLKRKADF